MDNVDLITEESGNTSSETEEEPGEENKGKTATKITADKKITPFDSNCSEEYGPLDDRSLNVIKLIERRGENVLKMPRETEMQEKIGIEKRLEDSDKALCQVIQLGDELVTNIMIANEKREVMRRNYEALKREDILTDLEKESIEALSKFEEITFNWGELDAIKEPVGLNEGLIEQKKRIEALMKQKDEAIRQCQDEIRRVDIKYYNDLERQTADIYCLVERIDNQMENIRRAFKSHIELLQESIEDERQTLALSASRKWQELFDKRDSREIMRLHKERERAAFYASEIARISLEHEELTRATRIRLERDAEALQLGLRNVQNNVLLNSEKFDYNYQVLQKADDENIITVNQQKRRLAKLNEAILAFKRKIRETKANSQAEIKKLSTEVMHLHTCIVELESKTENFTILDDRKYQAVWDVNLSEAMDLMNKILDIDRILHEQQLGLPWMKPDLPVFKVMDFITLKHSADSNHLELRIKKNKDSAKPEIKKGKDRRADEEKLSYTRLMRTILRKIADQGGFLLEDKLLDILKPYTEDQKTLVKIDNIFTALGITKLEDIRALVRYFLPYAWCPNCSAGLSINRTPRVPIAQFEKKDIERIRHDEVKEGSAELQDEQFISDEETSDTRDGNNPMDDLMKVFINRKDDLDGNQQVQKTVGEEQKINCPNHYLIIESAYVLTALREFSEKHLCKIAMSGLFLAQPKSLVSHRASRKSAMHRTISKTEVATFWHQFNDIFPEQRFKLWQNLEHGLNHYLKVLKERVSLDAECEFLRKQNGELKHLLQQYMPSDK